MFFFKAPPQYFKQDGDFETLRTESDAVNVRRTRRTLPAEWFTQGGVWLTWPHRDTDWRDCLVEITKTYIRLAYEIARREKLLVVHPHPEEVAQLLQERLPRKVVENIIFFRAPTNDTWTRDHGVLSVIDTNGWQLIDCSFNGWGGKFPAEKDNELTHLLAEDDVLKGTYQDALDFVLEGGSIESDGTGTILTTEQCVCSTTRGSGRTRSYIEARFFELFGTRRVLWLTHGHLEGDDTDGHIDTLARFCSANTICYVKCTNKSDSHYADLELMERELQTMRTAQGHFYNLVPLPMAPACYDDNGNRLPATYANFLILNTAIIFPTYGDATLDEKARRQFAHLFPKYDIIGIDARTLICQHGSIHCAAMQLPRGVI